MSVLPMAVTDGCPHCHSGLILLADTSELVAANPLLLDSSPLEVELFRLMHASSAPGTKAEGSPRAKEILKKTEESDGLTGKKRGRQESTCKKNKKIGQKTLLGGSPAAAVKRELPAKVRAKITDAMSGTDVKLILQKKLTESDLNPKLGRFSLPSSRILTDFLDQEERRWLETGGVITVPVIEPCLGVSHPALRSWKMSSRPFYVLTSEWNDLARKNHLRAGGLIQVWSFRTEGRIGFAIVKCDDDISAAATTAGDLQAVVSGPTSPSSVLECRPPY